MISIVRAKQSKFSLHHIGSSQRLTFTSRHSRKYHCAHVIAVGVAAASFCHHYHTPHPLVKAALDKATKATIAWNKGANLMPSSKLPYLSYHDLIETLEKLVGDVRKDVQLPFDASKKKKLFIKDREWKKHEAPAAEKAKKARKRAIVNGKRKKNESEEEKSATSSECSKLLAAGAPSKSIASNKKRASSTGQHGCDVTKSQSKVLLAIAQGKAELSTRKRKESKKWK